METEWWSDDVTGDGWWVTKRQVTSDGATKWWSLEMAEMVETLVEGLGGMEWDLD